MSLEKPLMLKDDSMNLSQTVKTELKLVQLRNILPRIFGELDDVMFKTILPFLEWKELPGNEYLFHQGDEGDSLYILVSGRLQVIIVRPGEPALTVGEITRGETVGEMALFNGAPRSAAIVAVRDSVLVRISREAFEQIISKYPTVVMNITRLIIDRLNERNSGKPTMSQVVNIAVVPLSRQLDMTAFMQSLLGEMKEFGSVLSLSATAINQRLQQEDIAHATQDSYAYHHLSAWLDEQETSHEYLLYESEYGTSEWTKRCLRQADEIILVADSNDTPDLKEIETRLLGGKEVLTTARQVLLLMHDPNKSISRTREWIEQRSVKAFHHIEKQSRKDMGRLARFLTGNANGLVLSGGGAKGLAHIGVHRALEERGIPIDMVGGTSIGSIIGSFIGLCWPSEELHRRTRKAFLSNPTPISDYNVLPIISLLKGRKLEGLLKDFLGETQIEDMRLNYFCVSSNLTQTQATVHQKGCLWRSIRASISLPGVFPPTLLNKDLHIDGGIFNNLPIDVMEGKGLKNIIAVDLDVTNTKQSEFHKIPSTWDIIKSKFGGKRKYYQIPSLMSTLIQSTTLNSDHKTRRIRSRANLFFNPDLTNFGLIEWKAFDKIVEAGYENAMQVLEEWKGFD